MNKKQIVVTAWIIEKNWTFLITQRPEEKHNWGRWEFPWWKVNFWEDMFSCIERELVEEIWIQTKATHLLWYSSHVYEENKHVLLFWIHCTYISWNIQLLDISDYAWVTINQMASYDITEADIPLIIALEKHQNTLH